MPEIKTITLVMELDTAKTLLHAICTQARVQGWGPRFHHLRALERLLSPEVMRLEKEKEWDDLPKKEAGAHTPGSGV